MSENVIWTVEGTIKTGQREELLALMREMIASVEAEAGTLNYEWTLGADGSSLHVYERYRDDAAVVAHLGTWARFAGRFTANVEITRFVVFSELSPALRETVAVMNPIYMRPIGGITR